MPVVTTVLTNAAVGYLSTTTPAPPLPFVAPPPPLLGNPLGAFADSGFTPALPPPPPVPPFPNPDEGPLGVYAYPPPPPA